MRDRTSRRCRRERQHGVGVDPRKDWGYSANEAGRHWGTWSHQERRADSSLKPSL